MDSGGTCGKEGGGEAWEAPLDSIEREVFGSDWEGVLEMVETAAGRGPISTLEEISAELLRSGVKVIEDLFLPLNCGVALGLFSGL